MNSTEWLDAINSISSSELNIQKGSSSNSVTSNSPKLDNNGNSNSNNSKNNSPKFNNRRTVVPLNGSDFTTDATDKSLEFSSSTSLSRSPNHNSGDNNSSNASNIAAIMSILQDKKLFEVLITKNMLYDRDEMSKNINASIKQQGRKSFNANSIRTRMRLNSVEILSDDEKSQGGNDQVYGFETVYGIENVALAKAIKEKHRRLSQVQVTKVSAVQEEVEEEMYSLDMHAITETTVKPRTEQSQQSQQQNVQEVENQQSQQSQQPQALHRQATPYDSHERLRKESVVSFADSEDSKTSENYNNNGTDIMPTHGTDIIRSNTNNSANNKASSNISNFLQNHYTNKSPDDQGQLVDIYDDYEQLVVESAGESGESAESDLNEGSMFDD